MKQRSKAVQLCFAVVLPFVFFAIRPLERPPSAPKKP